MKRKQCMKNRNSNRQKQYEKIIQEEVNWQDSRREKYILDYPNGETPFPTDSDLKTIIPLLLMADNELDNYSIGVYCRLKLLSHFKHDLNEIYKYGNKECITKSLNRLIELEYINKELKIIF